MDASLPRDDETPQASTRFYTAIFPEALAEGSEQSEFNPFVHGLRVGGRGRPRSGKGPCVARLEAAPSWAGRAPARPSRARCPRPQGEGPASSGPPQARCPRPQERTKAKRHFLVNALSSDHQPSEQPGNWSSDHRIAAATMRGLPVRETRAVMCGGAGARTARPPRIAFCRMRCQGVVTISCLGCFPYITGWKCRCDASCRTVVDLSGRRGQLGLGVMTMDGRADQPPRPFTSMMSTQVKKPAGLYTLLHVLHGSFSPKR